MGDRVNLPDDRDRQRTTVTDGFFEREIHLSRDATASFLRELADQVENDTRLTLSSQEWEIPFEYREPVEIEVEFSGGREAELEVEFEFTEPRGGDELSVE
ncbi:amphi-Trp domain-containing protein [Halorussus sp. MSC15.2]|uniref:amphi-Trp domain-containing protein n=1 Tax=Halorussus sp. MSC15.2 TaxID=2283638 RepID=UPI0013D32C0E|nr:amphi-Trp domain-containing protein [Halorussus sp. MSC15.2]NEU55378.1 amphi-Trp domain-containing protein [Halorussus sp. MSC15.2]